MPPDATHHEDRDLAERWLANERLVQPASRGPHERFTVPSGFDWDVYNAVLDLVLDSNIELNPAWSFATLLLNLAQDDQDIRNVAGHMLEPLLREHGTQLFPEVEARIQTDQRFRRALEGIYLYGQIEDLAVRYGVHRPHPT
jgi:hypothetical protein